MLYTGFRPQAADEHAPALSLDLLLVRNPAVVFFACMQGNAMLRSGIRHGDLLVIEAAEHYGHGSIVCALINREVLVRRLERAGQGYVLAASDTNIQPLVVTEDCEIRGQVVAAITLLARPRVSLTAVS
jgi:SOS-response transcriptional repressor LexA